MMMIKLTLQATMSTVDMDARIHIFAAWTPEKGRVASSKLNRLHPGKVKVIILQGAE